MVQPVLGFCDKYFPKYLIEPFEIMKIQKSVYLLKGMEYNIAGIYVLSDALAAI